MKKKSQRYFEHILSKTLCIYQGGKGGIKRLFGLTGSMQGTRFVFTREGFKREFKEIQQSEIERYFEENKKQPKIVLPEKTILAKTHLN